MGVFGSSWVGGSREGSGRAGFCRKAEFGIHGSQGLWFWSGASLGMGLARRRQGVSARAHAKTASEHLAPFSILKRVKRNGTRMLQQPGPVVSLHTASMHLCVSVYTHGTRVARVFYIIWRDCWYLRHYVAVAHTGRTPFAPVAIPGATLGRSHDGQIAQSPPPPCSPPVAILRLR